MFVSFVPFLQYLTFYNCNYDGTIKMINVKLTLQFCTPKLELLVFKMNNIKIVTILGTTRLTNKVTLSDRYYDPHFQGYKHHVRAFFTTSFSFVTDLLTSLGFQKHYHAIKPISGTMFIHIFSFIIGILSKIFLVFRFVWYYKIITYNM